MKRIALVFLLAGLSSRVACASDEVPRYDLRVRLRFGEAHLVRHNGEIAGTMVVSGRKIVSSVKRTTSYEIRVLESRAAVSKVRLTFRVDNTSGTSGGVTLYAPFSAAIEQPTSRVFNGDAIRGQSVDLKILSNGDVTPNFDWPPDSLGIRAHEAKTSAEKEKARRAIVTFEIRHQTIEKFRWFIGVRPRKPVAIGESWIGNITLNANYMRQRRVPILYTLTKVENNVAFVTLRVVERPEKKVRISMPKNMRDSDWNRQNGTMQIDLKSGWPLRAQENGQSFSQLQMTEKKSMPPRNFLTTYGKSISQVDTTTLPTFPAK